MNAMISVMTPDKRTIHIPFHRAACAVCHNADADGELWGGPWTSHWHYCNDHEHRPIRFSVIAHYSPHDNSPIAVDPPPWCPHRNGVEPVDRIRISNKFEQAWADKRNKRRYE